MAQRRNAMRRSGAHRARRLVAGGLVASVATLPPPAFAGDSECRSQFTVPHEAPPLSASEYNGHALPDVCLGPNASKNVFVIGDWGGIVYRPGMPPIPADKRSKLFPAFHRKFVWGIDDRAQLLVAAQMRRRAQTAPPDYVLNVGDNFYWGGVSGKCGALPFTDTASAQWKHIFEDVYWGPGLDGKAWLGILGNHDYGGYHFKAAWDNTIGYSWGLSKCSSKRWLTPAQYYSSKVKYDTFSVEYFFVDSNVNEAWKPEQNPSHNICGIEHNGKHATCGPQGPTSVEECFTWFHRLWENQMLWLDRKLGESKANWQIIVTHFPPKWATGEWECLADRHGLDAHISGHLHFQRLSGPWEDSFLKGTAVLISGGGGGITSEFSPHVYGDDDAYGFMHIALEKEEMKIETISHGGVVRKSITMKPRWPNKDRGVCVHPKWTDHFTPVDGGTNRACRGQSDSDDDGKNFLLVQNVPTPESCMRHCKYTVQCTGIEYGNKVCKVWVTEITTSVSLLGYSCLKLSWGKGEDAEVVPSRASYPSMMLREMGKDRQCRSASNDHQSWSDFQKTTAPTLAACERLCLNAVECTGVEFGPGTECNLWRVPVEASVHREGVVCVPAKLGDVPHADLVEVGGLLHV